MEYAIQKNTIPEKCKRENTIENYFKNENNLKNFPLKRKREISHLDENENIIDSGEIEDLDEFRSYSKPVNNSSINTRNKSYLIEKKKIIPPNLIGLKIQKNKK